MNDDVSGAHTGSVRAVTRALEILMAFYSKNELSASELLDRVDLSKPTLYRLLYTMESLDFIVSEGEPQRFRLGPAVGKLAQFWLSGLDIEKSAQPVMREIWEQTGETVALYVPEGKARLCLFEIASLQPLSFRRGAGHTDALWKGASGKAIMSGMAFGPGELRRFVDDPACDTEALEEELHAIVARGYAFSQSEMIQGAVAVATPIFDRTQQVAGSLVVYGPLTRLDLKKVEKIGELLRNQGNKISYALGC